MSTTKFWCPICRKDHEVDKKLTVKESYITRDGKSVLACLGCVIQMYYDREKRRASTKSNDNTNS